jgi:hypothetical protein
MPQQSPDQLADLISESQAGRADRVGLLPFLQRHIHPRPGRDWTLDRHEYLRTIAEDTSRVIAVKKAAQVGLSTLMVAELLRTCLAGYNAGYFLDTAGRMQKFVQARVDPIIDADEDLVRHVVEGTLVENELGPKRPRRRGGSPADNVRVKRVGRGTAYFLSTKVMGDVKTVDLDLICMDEVAELDDEKAQFAQDRLLHSDLKLQRWFSQPDIPGMDIDAWYQRSDQKHWKLRCGRCRSWWALELVFPDCLFRVRGEWRVGCPKCHTRLDPAAGEWVAAQRHARVSGYWISQLYGPQISADDIAEQWEQAQLSTKAMRRFRISILGDGYAGDRQPMPETFLLTRCGHWGISPAPTRQQPQGTVYIGFDQGDTLHLVVGRERDGILRIVQLEETADWEIIDQRIAAYAGMFAGDAMPYKPEVKRLIRKHRTGLMVYSSAQRMSFGLEEKESAQPVPYINVDRTEYMDAVADAFRTGQLWLPSRLVPETQTAIEHLSRFVKDKKEDGSYAYKRGVNNHYGMAIANMLLAIRGQTSLHLGPAAHLSELTDLIVDQPLFPGSTIL